MLSRVASRTEIVPQIQTANNIISAPAYLVSQASHQLSIGSSAGSGTSEEAAAAVAAIRAAPRTSVTSATSRGCARVLKVENSSRLTPPAIIPGRSSQSSNRNKVPVPCNQQQEQANHLTQPKVVSTITTTSTRLPGRPNSTRAPVPYFNPSQGASTAATPTSATTATNSGPVGVQAVATTTTSHPPPSRIAPPATTTSAYKGVDCLAKRRQLSSWLRQQVSNQQQPKQTNFSEELLKTSKTPTIATKSPGCASLNSIRSSSSSDSDHLAMATVRPISPQYQHALDSAISLAKELASRNMADSGESSPKTPDSPDKKRFNFKLKHFSKSFSEASANIRDIESSISYEAKQAYKSLIERGPFNSYTSHHHEPASHHNQFHHTIASPRRHNHSHHHHSSHHQYTNEEFLPTFSSSSKLKHMSTSDIKHKRGGIGW